MKYTKRYLLSTPQGKRLVRRRINVKKDRSGSLVAIGILLGLAAGCLYLEKLGDVTTNFVLRAIEPTEISTQAPSNAPALTVDEGEVEASIQVDDAGQQSPTSSNPMEWTTEEIKQYINLVFGEVAPQALLVAECESGLVADNIGDRNLITWNGDDIVGDSVGIFQIRTGGGDFNRAKANNMTPDEFRAFLKNPKNNIDYAKDIYDNGGWSAWTCKKVLYQ